MPLLISCLRFLREMPKHLLKASLFITFWSLITTCWSGTEVSKGLNTPSSTDSNTTPSLFGEDVVSLSAETAGLFSINNSNNYR